MYKKYFFNILKIISLSIIYCSGIISSDNPEWKINESFFKNQVISLNKQLGENFSKEDVFILCENIIKNKHIKDLDLSNNNLIIDRLIFIAQAINKSNIEKINLSNCNIGSSGVFTLCNNIKDNSSITAINLNGNGIAGWGITAFSKLFFEKKLELLELLELSENPLNPNSYNKIVLLLQNNYIKKLNLQNTCLNGFAIEKIVEGLLTSSCKSSNSLEHLNLSKNPIGDEGAISIRRLLAHNDSINFLDLSECSISLFGLKEIVSILKKYKKSLKIKFLDNIVGILPTLKSLEKYKNIGFEFTEKIFEEISGRDFQSIETYMYIAASQQQELVKCAKILFTPDMNEDTQARIITVSARETADTPNSQDVTFQDQLSLHQTGAKKKLSKFYETFGKEFGGNKCNTENFYRMLENLCRSYVEKGNAQLPKKEKIQFKKVDLMGISKEMKNYCTYEEGEKVTVISNFLPSIDSPDKVLSSTLIQSLAEVDEKNNPGVAAQWKDPITYKIENNTEREIERDTTDNGSAEIHKGHESRREIRVDGSADIKAGMPGAAEGGVGAKIGYTKTDRTQLETTIKRVYDTSGKIYIPPFSVLEGAAGWYREKRRQEGEKVISVRGDAIPVLVEINGQEMVKRYSVTEIFSHEPEEHLFDSEYKIDLSDQSEVKLSKMSSHIFQNMFCYKESLTVKDLEGSLMAKVSVTPKN